MPEITLVDSVAVESKSTGSNGIPSTKSFNLAEGDLMLGLFVFDSLSQTTPNVTAIGRTGGAQNLTPYWFRLGQVDSPQASSLGGVRTELWYMFVPAGMSGPNTPSANLSQSGTGSRSGVFAQFRGVDPSVNPSVSSGFGTNATNSVATPPYGLFIEGVGHEGNSQPSKATGTQSTTKISLGTTGQSSVTNTWATLGYMMANAGGFGATSSSWNTTDGGQIYASFSALPDVPPGDILNIGSGVGQNHFRLSLSQEEAFGAADDVSMAEIVAGFTDPLQFETVTGDRVRFSPVANYEAADSSPFARDELREVNPDGSDIGFNAHYGEHIMTGRTNIIQVPFTDPSVIIAKLENSDFSTSGIFCVGDGQGTFILAAMLQNATVFPAMNEFFSANTEFDWKIRVIDGVIEFYYNDMVTPSYSAVLPVPSDPDSWHFRVGAHNQFNSYTVGPGGLTPSPIDRSIVTLRNLSVEHTFGQPPIGNIEGILTAHAARWDFSDPSGYVLNGASQVISAVDRTGNNATLNAEGLPVIEDINGVPAVRFNGAQSLNGIAPTSIPQPFVAWAVVDMVNPTGTAEAFVGHIRGVLKANFNTFTMSGATSIVYSDTTADTSPHIVLGLFNGTESKIYVDDAVVENTGDAQSENANIYYLGRNGWGGEFANARIGESGVFPGVMAESDIALLMDYLTDKWISPTPPGGDVQKIAIGSALVGLDKLYIGSTKINRVYVGDVMVYDDVT